MTKIITLIIAMSFFSSCATSQTMEAKSSQSEKLTALPFHQIPDAPDHYSAETVAARTIDGLGYRYYWATKDLRPEDLEYRIGEDSRTIGETLQHMFGLSTTIVNGVTGKANGGSEKPMEMTWEEKRAMTLHNLKMTSDILRNAKEGSLEDFKIVFQRGEKSTSYPFWNMINGPVADAIWHAGQIVMMRRAAGNPLPPGVSVFTGKTKE